VFAAALLIPLPDSTPTPLASRLAYAVLRPSCASPHLSLPPPARMQSHLPPLSPFQSNAPHSRTLRSPGAAPSPAEAQGRGGPALRGDIRACCSPTRLTSLQCDALDSPRAPASPARPRQLLRRRGAEGRRCVVAPASPARPRHPLRRRGAEGRRCVVASRRGKSAMRRSRKAGFTGHACRHSRSSRGSAITRFCTCATCIQGQGTTTSSVPAPLVVGVSATRPGSAPAPRRSPGSGRAGSGAAAGCQPRHAAQGHACGATTLHWTAPGNQRPGVHSGRFSHATCARMPRGASARPLS